MRSVDGQLKQIPWYLKLYVVFLKFLVVFDNYILQSGDNYDLNGCEEVGDEESFIYQNDDNFIYQNDDNFIYN